VRQRMVRKNGFMENHISRDDNLLTFEIKELVSLLIKMVTYENARISPRL